MIDGFFIHHIANELHQELSHSRLEKIVQQDEHSFVFLFYQKGQRQTLLIDLSSENFRIHITKHPIKNQMTSHFVMMLKKQLEGAILDQIVQHLTDRVVILEFTSYDMIDGPVKKMLVFEAMGKHSNLILVKDGIIIDTFKKMFFESGRQLLPQALFSFFPTDKSIACDINYQKITSPKDLVNQYMGVSPLLSNYLYEHRCQWHDIKLHPTRNVTKHKFYAFDLFDGADEKKYYASLSEMLDDDLKKDKPIYVSEKLFIEKQLKKLSTKKEQLEMSLEQAEHKLSKRELGDFIYQSGYDLTLKMSDIQFNDQKYVLDATKTLNENAQEAYKAYQKAKRGIHHIKEQILNTKELIEHFESLSFFITVTSHDSIKDIDQELIAYGYKKSKTLNHSKKKDKPHFIVLKDDKATYMIGKNNLQNEYITHTLAKKDDYFFHVKDAPGSHVIVSVDELDEIVLRKACMLAAYFSTMRQSSSIPVDYTRVRHLKKIPKTPGYKVIYHKYQTMYIDIDNAKITEYLKNV